MQGKCITKTPLFVKNLRTRNTSLLCFCINADIEHDILLYNNITHSQNGISNNGERCVVKKKLKAIYA